ncbi:MAG: hypothetical protein SGI97_07605 [candidate division Zixibacteria bacterium]|nr:hypothetical protein [candidate division Zixibacteria bacterium]
MNRRIVFTFGILIFLVATLVMNCADPLEGESDNPILGPVNTVDTIYINGDTILVTDTVFVGGDTIVVTDTIIVDTLNNTDTTIIRDTVIVIDTVIVVDTLIVIVPDSTGPTTACAQLGSNQQEIVWMLRYPSGMYRMEFDAYTEQNQPNQSVTVNIDGQEFQWPVGQDPSFVTERTLNDLSVIRITVNKPPARGHYISICLKLTAL